jgi:outer membrane biogenesis lipoprotein LolB
LNHSNNSIFRIIIKPTIIITLLSSVYSCTHFNFHKLPQQNANVILSRQIDNSAKIKAFEAKSTSKIAGPKGNFVVKMFVFYENKPQMRIDNNTPFGHPVSSFIYRRNGFKLYDIKENVVVTGTSSEKNLEKLIGLPISANELMALMSTNIPATINQGILYNDSGKFYFDTYKSRFETGFFKLNEKKLLSEVELSSDDLTLKISYSKYSNINNIEFPKRIVIKINGTILSLNFRNMSFKPKIDTKHFRLNAPRNAKKIRLD